jgi:hypothetical protein
VLLLASLGATGCTWLEAPDVEPGSEPGDGTIADVRVPPDRSAYAGCTSVAQIDFDAEDVVDLELTTDFDGFGFTAAEEEIRPADGSIFYWTETEGGNEWGLYTRSEQGGEPGGSVVDATYDGADWVRMAHDFDADGQFDEVWQFAWIEDRVQQAEIDDDGDGSVDGTWTSTVDERYHPLSEVFDLRDDSYEMTYTWQGEQLRSKQMTSEDSSSLEERIYADDTAPEPIRIERNQTDSLGRFHGTYLLEYDEDGGLVRREEIIEQEFDVGSTPVSSTNHVLYEFELDAKGRVVRTIQSEELNEEDGLVPTIITDTEWSCP